MNFQLKDNPKKYWNHVNYNCTDVFPRCFPTGHRSLQMWNQKNKSKLSRMQISQSRKNLYLAAIIGNLLYISVGCVMGWSSPVLPKLLSNNLITESQSSWIGSIYCLGAAVGSSISGLTIDSFGRKNTLLMTMTYFIISWSIIAATAGLSDNILYIYIGRIIGGLGVGSTFATMSVYLAEISDNEVRGAIGSLNQMFVGLGLIAQYSIGPNVSYTNLALISASWAALFGVLFIFMPETPYYLMQRGKTESAVRSLCWLRGSVQPPEVLREIDLIKENIKLKGSGSKRDLFTKKGCRKAFAISLWAMLCQQITGVNVVFSFSQDIFDMATKSISPQISSILIGGTNIITSSFAPPLVKRFGVKKILVTFGLGMSICQMLLALFFYLLSIGEDMSHFAWLPVTSLIVFNACFCIGPGPLPWTSVAELFPPHVKGLASSLIGPYVWLIAFALIKNYNALRQLVGNYPVFLIFGIGELIGVLVMAVIQPNTKGLSFQEIQDLLQGHNSQDDAILTSQQL